MSVVSLAAFGADGWYEPLRHQSVHTLDGRELAHLSLPPNLWVGRQLRRLDASRRSVADRRCLLAEAAAHFTTGTFAGMNYSAYRRAVSEVAGLPCSVVESATDVIAAALRDAVEIADAARPASAVRTIADAGTGGAAVWARKGATLGVNAAGNHPGVHSLWIEALALGYGVAVRPSRKEPLTPHRMVAALEAAGLTGAEIQLIPGTPELTQTLMDGTDFGIVYGGDAAVAPFIADPRVLVQGPGRSKIAVTADPSATDIDMIVSSIADQGGTACVNATAVFTAGDHIALAKAVAAELQHLPALPPEDPAAVLPCTDSATGAAFAGMVSRAIGSAQPVLAPEDMLGDLGDGRVVLRPVVVVCDSESAPQAGMEMPFPCVWVLPWTKNPDVLRHSLVLTVIGPLDGLDGFVHDPTIRNLYLGAVPTHWMRLGLPHDGYLAESLMESKTTVCRRST